MRLRLREKHVVGKARPTRHRSAAGVSRFGSKLSIETEVTIAAFAVTTATCTVTLEAETI